MSVVEFIQLSYQGSGWRSTVSVQLCSQPTLNIGMAYQLGKVAVFPIVGELNGREQHAMGPGLRIPAAFDPARLNSHLLELPLDLRRQQLIRHANGDFIHPK